MFDLGHAPPTNAYLSPEQLSLPEVHLPLKVLVCESCWLVQTADYVSPQELFAPDYAYFSSTSSSWLNHARAFSVSVAREFGLGSNSFVVEVASNDGYLLRNFVAMGIPCLGIEPTSQTADAAEELGIPVLRQFFTEAVSRLAVNEFGSADLVVANNVIAHVPDINDFTKGLSHLLKPDGILVLEFQHLLGIVEDCLFDTVYHEHFSYLSLIALQSVLACADLRIWRVEVLPTHGGSLRVFACRSR
jgi:SAM-dependent methyltransferase